MCENGFLLSLVKNDSNDHDNKIYLKHFLRYYNGSPS